MIKWSQVPWYKSFKKISYQLSTILIFSFVINASQLNAQPEIDNNKDLAELIECIDTPQKLCFRQYKTNMILAF